MAMTARRLTRLALLSLLALLVLPTLGSSASPAARQVTAYLDLRTPRASVVSYATALRAERWQDACAHQSRAVRTGDEAACVGQLSSLGVAVRTLRVSILNVALHGGYAEVSYLSTLGFARGVATLERRGRDWLITGFLPRR
jgi:hypothetical protein